MIFLTDSISQILRRNIFLLYIILEKRVPSLLQESVARKFSGWGALKTLSPPAYAPDQNISEVIANGKLKEKSEKMKKFIKFQ